MWKREWGRQGRARPAPATICYSNLPWQREQPSSGRECTSSAMREAAKQGRTADHSHVPQPPLCLSIPIAALLTVYSRPHSCFNSFSLASMLFRGFIVLHWRTRSHPVSRLSPLWHVQVQEMLVIPPLALYSKSMTNWAPSVTNNRWGLPLWALSSKQWCNTFFYSTFLHPGTKWTFQNQVEAKGNRCFGWVFYVHWQHVSDFVGGCFRIEESERSNCSGGWILCSSLNTHDANKHFLEEGDEMFVWKPENRAFTKHLPMVKVFLKHCLLCWHVDREKLQRLPFIHSLHSSVMLTLYYNFRTVNKKRSPIFNLVYQVFS